ncbi:uncharacterized protein LOC118435075 [Folsomia candida]|uniref:uncharacterized protein LOC118435075 n=1 Tax=Folsomia candida TaxID=158441 RepID=UPI001604DEEA|nr:uncharacterized protein LOC118435075 [Folsomia candida]
MAKAGVTTRMTKEIHFASELGYYVLNGNNKGKPKRQSLANYLGNNWKTSCSEAMQRKNANPRNIAMSLLCTSKRKALTPNMDIFYCAVLLYIPKDFDLDPFRNETRSWSDLITDPSIRRQYYFGKWKSEDGQFGMRWSHFTARDKRSSQVKDRLLDEKDPCICLELIVTLCEEMYVAEQTEGFWMAYGDQMNVMTDSDLFIITKPDATIPIAKEATARMLANDHEEDGTSFFKFIDEDETPYPPYFATLDECEAGHFCIKKSSVTERWVSGTREDNNKYKIIRDATIQLCR